MNTLSFWKLYLYVTGFFTSIKSLHSIYAHFYYTLHEAKQYGAGCYSVIAYLNFFLKHDSHTSNLQTLLKHFFLYQFTLSTVS